MKSIREHNAEMAAHMAKWFAPDPGKRPVVFVYLEERGIHVAFANVQNLPCAGFLNYDGKFEMKELGALGNVMLTRRDMSDTEFAALEEFDSAKFWRRAVE